MSLKDFQVIQKLGEGAYSSVFKVKRHGDGQEYALKKVKMQNLSDKEKENALNEVRILASIRCNTIIGYKEAFLDEISNSLCIVMEYANHGDLFQKIVEHQKKGQLFPENEIWNIFIQMVKGIKALHDLKIFHRDLKSANIFLNTDGTVKLGDMNVSKVAKKGLLYTQTGTPYYASPEVWKDQPYDAKSDIWSLGCVLYEMITLKPPFRAEDMEGLYKKVIRGYYPRIPPHFSQDLANVVRALLQVAPHLRPSADKILQLPAMVKRVNEVHMLEVDEGVPILLTTIRVPKNLHYLTDKLPKPNYMPLKTKKVDRTRFLQTIGVTRMDRQGSTNDDDENASQISHSLALPMIHHSSAPGGKMPSSKAVAAAAAAAANANSIASTLDMNSHNNSMNNNSGIFKDNLSDSASINHSIVTDQQSVKKKRKKDPQNDISSLLLNQPQMSNNPNNNSSGSQAGLLAGSNQADLKRKYELLREKKPAIDLMHDGSSRALKQQYELPGSSLTPNLKRNSPLNLGAPSTKNMVLKKEQLLDIEGESKPLLKKGKKSSNLVHSSLKHDDSLLQIPMKSDEGSRLPAIGGGKLPKIGGGYNMNPNALGSPRSYGLSEKENLKIKEIQRAYKVNSNQLDEIKDRYMNLKKAEAVKMKPYGIKPNLSPLELGIGGHKYNSHESSLPSLHKHK